MRVMILAKESPAAETATVPTPEAMTAMVAFHEELVGAGILLATDRLRPSSDGVRVRFDGDKPTVIDGPFTESKELIGGYWLWQVRSLDEAIAWVRRAPFGAGTELEIRPVYEHEDFGAAFVAAAPPQQARLDAKGRTPRG